MIRVSVLSKMSESRKRLKSSYERPLCRCAVIYFAQAGSSYPTIYNSLLHSLKPKRLRWDLESWVMAGYCGDDNHSTVLKSCPCRLLQDGIKTSPSSLSFTALRSTPQPMEICKHKSLYRGEGNTYTLIQTQNASCCHIRSTFS